MTEKFMFFENFKNTADKLPDDLRLKFYDALTDYVFFGTEAEDPVIDALVTAIKPSLDKEDTRGGSRSGAGRPKSNENQTEIKNNQKNQKCDFDCFEKSNEIKNNQNAFLKKNENQKNQSFLETETETEKEISPPVVPPSGENTPKDKAKQKRFTPPTVEEVRSFVTEHGYGVDADRFVNFYTSKGWVVGRSPMKDWHAAVRTWAADKKTATCSEQTGGIPFKSWREAARAQGVEV